MTMTKYLNIFLLVIRRRCYRAKFASLANHTKFPGLPGERLHQWHQHHWQDTERRIWHPHPTKGRALQITYSVVYLQYNKNQWKCFHCKWWWCDFSFFPSEKDAFCLQGHSAQTNDFCWAQQLSAGTGLLQEASYVCQVQVSVMGLHRVANVHAICGWPGCPWAGAKRGTDQRHYIPAWQEETPVCCRWAHAIFGHVRYK